MSATHDAFGRSAAKLRRTSRWRDDGLSPAASVIGAVEFDVDTIAGGPRLRQARKIPTLDGVP
jgi:hypothetical protein